VVARTLGEPPALEETLVNSVIPSHGTCISGAIQLESTAWKKLKTPFMTASPCAALSALTAPDVTLIAAPPSTKNKTDKREAEMHQTRKGKALRYEGAHLAAW
jgi:hypothetical protein